MASFTLEDSLSGKHRENMTPEREKAAGEMAYAQVER